MKAAFRYQLVSHIVDTSGAADVLQSATRASNRGPKGNGDMRTFLILLLLAAADGELTIERMHQIGTRELPRNIQLELGTVRSSSTRYRRNAAAPRGLPAKFGLRAVPPLPDTEHEQVDMPIDELYHLTRKISAKLAWTGPKADGLTKEEKAQRQDIVREVSDRLLRATLPERPGSSYALDESGIWAWARGRKSRRNPTEPAADEARDDDEPGGVALADEPAPVAAPGRPLSTCPDATWGTKTGKDGTQDAYFGYGLHALVRIPDLRHGPSFTDEDDPVLIAALELTPAATDVVDVSLGLLDRVRAHHPVKDLAADRHYSYKEWNRWAHQLWTRGIRPVLDLRENEHGFRDYDGAKVAASWPHCPGTPNRLGTIHRPGIGAPKADREKFDDLIAERQTYAMRRVKSHIPDGASRWECPARAGKIGCPHVEGTVEVAHQLDLPVVARPPAEDAKPTCCTQRTFMIRVQPPTEDDTRAERDRKTKLAQAMKHAQDEYWGDQRWVTSFNRRTHVEGAFGNLKNPNTENVHRGLFRFMGLPLVTLAITAAATATNLRQLRNWHDRTGNGDPCNPLLAPEPEFHGFVLLTNPNVIDASTEPDDLELPEAA
ncbi:hypothetical protein [Nocardioides halotolerans]|uniref:hypothetical protein n=1 Tax=Nocardioides halotolerans TaxID=433660 RepID=UPI0003FEC0CF|nr:hypothetical protein [Nocardioides halotolerans]